MKDLEAEYRHRYDAVLVPVAKRLESYLANHFRSFPRVDRVSARAKSVDRFLAKSRKQAEGMPKYTEPLAQIQDQIGARVVTFYQQDVEALSRNVEEFFRKIESRQVVPDSESEFGYFGKHFILFLPSDLFDDTLRAVDAPKFFELQVKTLFQHAWAEANHDLAYKPGEELTTDQKRRVAFTSAQSWGADQVFSELFAQLGSVTVTSTA
jgi:ppGpp synthetase/RelA/SpoT-type nucleotidyltranferase